MAPVDATAGTLTWLGHSCAAIRLDGLVIVTDPVLRSRVIHLRRKEPVAPGAVDGVGVVLISHSHYDHLDLPSLDRLDRGAQVLVPAGAGGLLRRRGFRFVREVVGRRRGGRRRRASAGDPRRARLRVPRRHREDAAGRLRDRRHAHRLLRGRHRPLPGDGCSGADRRGSPARRGLGPAPTGRPSRSRARRGGARADPSRTSRSRFTGERMRRGGRRWATTRPPRPSPSSPRLSSPPWTYASCGPGSRARSTTARPRTGVSALGATRSTGTS